MADRIDRRPQEPAETVDWRPEYRRTPEAMPTDTVDGPDAWKEVGDGQGADYEDQEG